MTQITQIKTSVVVEAVGLVALTLMTTPILADPVDIQFDVPLSNVPEGLRITNTLHRLVSGIPSSRAVAPDVKHIQEAKSRGVKLRRDGKVFVEIVGPEGSNLLEDVNIALLRSLGVEINRKDESKKSMADGTLLHLEPMSVAGNRAEAYVPVSQMAAAAKALPEKYRIHEVLPPDLDAVAGEGPAAVNSDSYRDAGHDGNGLKVGVIDYGYTNLGAAQANGDAPSTYTQRNYTGDTFVDGGTHGTGCVEAMYDHAPGADWVIYKIDSVSDMNSVVTHAIANGVDVLSMSQSRYNLGWNDNTGTACTEANRASDNGIVFFTSAGNRALSHWQGAFSSPDGDAFHEWVSGDEAISIRVDPDQGGNYYLSWSNAATDLDFYLYDAAGQNVIVSSTQTGVGVFEKFYYENTTASAQSLNIAVYRKSGSSVTDLEVFTHNANTWNQHAIAENSTTSPSNCTQPNVISVGAVDEDLYASANGSNVIASYSSQGPSNSGMTLPDISGPTDTTGLTYPTGFGGTSSATPNVAGAAAAFWSSDTNLIASGISWLIKEQADLWRDWGAAGNDNVYGKGGAQLIDYRYGTRWLADNYPGLTDDGTVPFETTQAAHDHTPSNGRILVFGDNYPVPAILGKTGKRMNIELVPDSGVARFGY